MLILIKPECLQYQNGRNILRPYHLYQDVCVYILKNLSFKLKQDVEYIIIEELLFLEISNSFQLRFIFKNILYNIYLYSNIVKYIYVKDTSTTSIKMYVLISSKLCHLN